MLELRLRGVSKYFGSRRVFQGISETAREGQCLVVAGPNGSGKSTLLRIIAGLLYPTDGEVSISKNGQTFDEDQRRDVIGMVAPDIALYDELSAIENLRFFSRVRGAPAGEQRLIEILDLVGLSGREGDLLASFSSGMKQRLKYAFALLHNPGILLLDEPSANLDSAGLKMADTLIIKQKTAGLVVLATNDQRELAYGDKVIELGN